MRLFQIKRIHTAIKLSKDRQSSFEYSLYTTISEQLCILSSYLCLKLTNRSFARCS